MLASKCPSVILLFQFHWSRADILRTSTNHIKQNKISNHTLFKCIWSILRWFVRSNALFQHWIRTLVCRVSDLSFHIFSLCLISLFGWLFGQILRRLFTRLLLLRSISFEIVHIVHKIKTGQTLCIIVQYINNLDACILHTRALSQLECEWCVVLVLFLHYGRMHSRRQNALY